MTMAYCIQCHIVEPDEEKIKVVVSFYGENEEDAQDAYDAYFDQNLNLEKIDKEERLVVEEGEIPDDQLPELEEDEAEPQA
jgi:hypothetical protein